MVFKYLRIGINSFKSQNIFSIDSIISSIMDIISIVVLAFVWSYLGFKKSLEYFFIVFLSNLFIPDVNLLRGMDEKIRKGEITLDILRPIRYDLKLYFSFLFSRTFFFLEVLILVIFGIFLEVNFVRVLKIIPVILLSSLLTFYMYFMFFPISVKTESSWGFARTFDLFFKRLLSGQMIPTSFLREYIGKVYDFLPFKYMVGFIAESYFGKINFLGILIQIFWIVVFFFNFKCAL